jgi:transposase
MLSFISYPAMSHSKDLRKRALKFVEEGGSIKEACLLFEVSRSSFQRWRLKQKNTGNLAPKSRIRVPYKIDNDELNAFIDKHPDAYLNEVAAHFQVTIPCVSIALKRLKITRKKRVHFTKKETI